MADTTRPRDRDPLQMSAQEVASLPTTEFKELVRKTAYYHMKKLLPVSEIMNGEDIRNMVLWFSSFVLSWSDDCASAPRDIVAAMFRKVAETIEASEKYN